MAISARMQQYKKGRLPMMRKVIRAFREWKQVMEDSAEEK